MFGICNISLRSVWSIICLLLSEHLTVCKTPGGKLSSPLGLNRFVKLGESAEILTNFGINVPLAGLLSSVV